MNPWDRLVCTIREVADVIEREAPPAVEVIRAAKQTLKALESFEDTGDAGPLSPARQRLAKALKTLNEKT